RTHWLCGHRGGIPFQSAWSHPAWIRPSVDWNANRQSRYDATVMEKLPLGFLAVGDYVKCVLSRVGGPDATKKHPCGPVFNRPSPPSQRASLQHHILRASQAEVRVGLFRRLVVLLDVEPDRHHVAALPGCLNDVLKEGLENTPTPGLGANINALNPPDPAI